MGNWPTPGVQPEKISCGIKPLAICGSVDGETAYVTAPLVYWLETSELSAAKLSLRTTSQRDFKFLVLRTLILDIIYRPFRRDDFKDYRSWFDDDCVQKALGPMDDEWLEHVLAEVPPTQFSFLSHGELIAVAGIALPNRQHPSFVITDLAVNPSKRRKGVGARVIRLLQNSFQESECFATEWKAFVALDNPAAQQFFSNLNWVRNPGVEDNMYCYCFRP